jgi:Protein of unknown function (DUF1207)
MDASTGGGAGQWGEGGPAALRHRPQYIAVVKSAPRPTGWRHVHALSLAAMAAWFPIRSLLAQRFLPANVQAFELPAASPRATGFAGRIISASVGDSRFGAETEADVNIGENIPVYLLTRSPTPWLIDFGVGNESRFSLTDPKSALISTDWTVGFDVSGRVGRFPVAVRLYHESSHLGDEYADHFAAPRIDWTREYTMGWVGVPLGPLTLRGAFGWVLHDQLGLKRGLAEAAVDYRSRGFLAGGMAARWVGGLDSQSAADVNWQWSTSARFGIELGPLVGHRVAFSIVGHTGLSTQRQFYTARSRYLGGEIRFDL